MKIRSLLILLLSMWIAPLILAEQTPQSLADAELPSLLTIYKDLHSHPELSTKEERSAGIVAKELRAAGCDVTENFGKYDNSDWKCYGVVGVMKNGAGPTVLVRTDLDALPVHEETGLPYASTVTVKTEEGKEGEGPIDVEPALEDFQALLQRVFHPFSKRQLADKGEVRVHSIPAIRYHAVAQVCHHEECGDRDGDEDLVAYERHETQVEACANRRIDGGRLASCTLEDLVTCIQVLESEHCANCQTGSRMGQQIDYVRQYTSEMQPMTTGQEIINK